MIEMTRMDGVKTTIKSFNDSLLAESRKENQKVQDMLNRVAEGVSGSMRQNAERYINTKVEEDVAKAREEAEKKYSAEYGIARNTGFHDEKYDDAFKGLLSSATGRMDRTIENGKNDMQALKEQIMKEQQFQREAQAFKQLTGW